MSKICGTCKHVGYKIRKGAGVPRDGYCYGNPPQVGGIRPKVGLTDRACGLYQEKASKDSQVIKTEE